MRAEPLFICLLTCSLSIGVNREFSLLFCRKVSHQGLGPSFSPRHPLWGAAVGRSGAGRASAMPLRLCLLSKSVSGSTIHNVSSQLQQVVEKRNPARHWHSPRTAAVALPLLGHLMTKSIHFQGMVFPKSCLCAWAGTAYSPPAPTPACLLLQLTCSCSTTSL